MIMKNNLELSKIFYKQREYSYFYHNKYYLIQEL